MWYSANDKKSNKLDKYNGANEKLILSLAENIIRKKFFLQGNYQPPKELIDKNLCKFVKQAENKYDNIENIRNKINNTDLYPVVKSIVEEFMK